MVWMLVGGESGEKSVFAHMCMFIRLYLFAISEYLYYLYWARMARQEYMVILLCNGSLITVNGSHAGMIE